MKYMIQYKLHIILDFHQLQNEIQNKKGTKEN